VEQAETDKIINNSIFNMDREIPKEVRNKERNKKIIRYGGIGVASIIVISVLISFMRTGVKTKDLVFSTVDKGTIEVSVSASGKVVPAFEEIINSPINTRIVEIYKKGGDSVDVGTPILKLDLQSVETDYKKLLDEEQMRSYKLNQLQVNNQTKLNDLAMKIKVSVMQLNRKKVELRNEQYLDSLGSGTTDKVRQAELSYNVAQLEYEQLKQQYDNEKEVLAAEYKVQELDFSIFRKGLAEMKRTLDDAQIRSPRKAILTYINNQIGAQVSQGSQIAVISDLSHFKVEGEIADTYGDRVAAGGKAIVKIGSEKLEGTVSSVTPLSKNGVISFTVQLNEDNNRRLRSGLKTDVYVMNAVKEDVMRIANASYYVGRGEYELFVRNSDKEIVKRKVQLGDSNFEFVEVASGLQPGDQVVVSDMSNYKNKNKLKLN
jgi:HlyD family secretion protein